MKKRILYVENNPNNMLLIKRIVQAEGHDMLEAVDGESGWEMALREQPDFILMDLRLPGEIDGLELTRRIKANPELARIPIAILTAYGDLEIEKEAKAAGCAGFLYKPATIQQIRALLHQFLSPPDAYPHV